MWTRNHLTDNTKSWQDKRRNFSRCSLWTQRSLRKGLKNSVTGCKKYGSKTTPKTEQQCNKMDRVFKIKCKCARKKRFDKLLNQKPKKLVVKRFANNLVNVSRMELFIVLQDPEEAEDWLLIIENMYTILNQNWRWWKESVYCINRRWNMWKTGRKKKQIGWLQKN